MTDTPDLISRLREATIRAAIMRTEDVRIQAADARALLAVFAQVERLEEEAASWKADAGATHIKLTTALAEIERLTSKNSHLRLEAQIWAQEARTQQATVHDAYQVVTGATGEPGDWNGANPIRAEIERLNVALRYEENRSGRIGTHDPNCHTWGPSHYECLLAKYDGVREALNAPVEGLRKAFHKTRLSGDVMVSANDLAELFDALDALGAPDHE